MRTNEEKQLVTQALDTLASAIERGEGEQLKAYLSVFARFHRYSIGNVLLIAMQRPGAAQVAGARTWNRLGRHVRKGEKGIRIPAPIVWRRKKHEQPQEEDSDTEELVRFRTV